MRIIGGQLKGQRFSAPQNLPVRPTTDLAKEALFNILDTRVDFDQLEVLDLFSGTGNIAFEFASRGAARVTAVDQHARCGIFVKQQAAKWGLGQIQVQRADVFRYLKRETESYDLVFADPPYDLPALTSIPEAVFDSQVMKAGAYLILEHPTSRKISEGHYFVEQRKYGNSSFSIYRKPASSEATL